MISTGNSYIASLDSENHVPKMRFEVVSNEFN